MSKQPPKPRQNPLLFRPAGGPTVPLPPGAAGGARPTVGLPPSALGRPAQPQRPTPAMLLNAVREAAQHFQRKDFARSGAILKQVLQANPEHADALHLLGLIALENARFADAEELIGMAAKAASKPTPNMLVNLGNACREQGKFNEANAAYERALSIDSGYIDAIFNRGIARKYESKDKEALADFDEVIRRRPDHRAAYIRATQAAMDLGLFRDALSYTETAVEKLPEPHPILFTLMADIEERLSDLDKALECAEKALGLDPSYPEALRIWARVRRRRHGKDAQVLIDIRDRLDALDRSGCSFDAGRGIEEELAQTCQQLGDYDAAFLHFTRMNEEAQREAAAISVDTRTYLAQVEDLISTFTPEFVQGWAPFSPMGKETGHRGVPVFLVGFPRSGTTLLDQIFDAHPDIQVMEEKILLRKVRDAALDFEAGYPGLLPTLSDPSRAQLRQIYWQALESEGADLAARHVVDKMPLSIIHAGLIARVFPEAKIILALRHPADSVLSCFMQNFRLNESMVNFLTLENAALLYDRVMTLWQRYRELLPLNVVEVRYENLIRDLRGEVEPALNFLGLEWNEAQADPAAHALARGTIRTPSYAQVTQPIYSSAADRWRRYDKYLAPVMPLLEKHIRYFGYSL